MITGNTASITRIVNLVWHKLVNNTVSAVAACATGSSCIRCMSPAKAQLPLCLPCQFELPSLDEQNLCPHCGMILARSELTICSNCLDEYPAYDQLRAGFDYRGVIAEHLKRFKYQQEMLSGQLVMRLFWQLLADELTGLMPMTLVPVPSHPGRLQVRGFNQAYQIALFLAQRLGWNLDYKCLQRSKATQLQHSLTTAERRKNLANAFVVQGPAPQRVVIIDDIVTTGATVGACAKALRAAGSEYIEVWCMARTSLR